MKATLGEKMGRGKSKTERSGILQSYWLLKWWFLALAFSLFHFSIHFPINQTGHKILPTKGKLQQQRIYTQNNMNYET
ncbi:hypothetical protein C1H46_016356 [Malus baccata]|uniref:Uncharacterized protein n=1 Tax=Malus baccata TaxID=106549 RepID=A0A540MIJ8_MALBA|nr:hypothetical protein C1H46_016356 [Malus baccata]